MITGKIIPFGYADSGVPALERLMVDERTMLIDIRLSPRSRWHPAFNRAALASRFPNRYVNMPELGNLHYRPQDREKGIKLANPGRGIPRLANGLSQGYTLILMCACKDYVSCHRHTVVDLLLETMPDAQVELPEADGDTLKLSDVPSSVVSEVSNRV